jgi:hypothetical protein
VIHGQEYILAVLKRAAEIKTVVLPRGDVTFETQRWCRAALRENVLLQIGGGLG